MDKVLARMGDKAPEILRMMDAVETVREELAEGMDDRRHEHGDEEGHEEAAEEHEERELDEHVWTSPNKRQTHRRCNR